MVQNECREDDLDNPIFQEILSPGQTYMNAVKVRSFRSIVILKLQIGYMEFRNVLLLFVFLQEGAREFLNSVKNSLTKKLKSEDEKCFTLSSSLLVFFKFINSYIWLALFHWKFFLYIKKKVYYETLPFMVMFHNHDILYMF